MTKRVRGSVFERFWPKVEKTESCWLWTARRLPSGYGTLNINSVPNYAHRLAWQFTRGPIPKGSVVCHSCDNPSCVRPDHLFLGTQKDNLADMTAKGRRGTNGYELKTHCKSGHEFTPENTYHAKTGRRGCKTCMRVFGRRADAKRRPRKHPRTPPSA